MNKTHENRTKIIFAFLISLLFFNSSNSQTSIDYNWYLNANVGFSQCYGDVQDETNPFAKLQNETEMGFGLRAGRYLSPVFTGHTQFVFSNFIGQKTINNTNFRSGLFETQLGFTVNLINLFSKVNRNHRVNLYTTSGIGMIFFRSKLHQTSTGNLIDSYGYKSKANNEKSKSENAFIIPLGAGIDFRVSERWYVNFESVIRFINTDRLDAVESGSQNDSPLYTSLGLTYHFGKKKPARRKEIKKTTDGFPTLVTNDSINLEYVIPEEIISGNEFDLKCMISKGSIRGKARLTQVLPVGFIVRDTIISGARAEFKNYTLSLSWDELPEDSIFEINYTILPKRVFGTFPFTSILYLEDSGKEYKFNSSIVVSKPNVEVDVSQQKLFVSEISTRTENSAEDTLSNEKATTDVEFRVQIRAARKAIDPIHRLAQRYRISDEIKEGFSNGWYRYSMGSFLTYRDAKEFREILKTNNAVSDAFVIAYVNGKRLNELSELIKLAPLAYPSPQPNYIKEASYYSVQILAVKQKQFDVESFKSNYGIQWEVNEEVYHNYRKYTVGHFSSLSEAMKMQNLLIEKGVLDAFVVNYRNGQRITINQRVN